MTIPLPPTTTSPKIPWLLIVSGLFALVGITSFLLIGASFATPKAPDIQPTPIPTPIPTETQPPHTVMTFTALSCSVSNGDYRVISTEGQILIFPDYASWDQILPHGTYVADVTQRDGKFYVIDAHLFGYETYYRPWVVGEERYYPEYYEDDYGNYWQYDGHRYDKVSWKQVRNERIIRENPPGYGAGNPDRSIMYGSGNPWQGVNDR